MRDDRGFRERGVKEGMSLCLPPLPPVSWRHKQRKNEKGHPPHPKASCAHTYSGALSHTNDDHYSLELKGAGEVDCVIPFTKICPPHVAKPEHLKPCLNYIRTVNGNN